MRGAARLHFTSFFQTASTLIDGALHQALYTASDDPKEETRIITVTVRRI